MLKLGGNCMRMEFEYSIWMNFDDARHRKQCVPVMRWHINTSLSLDTMRITRIASYFFHSRPDFSRSFYWTISSMQCTETVYCSIFLDWG
jgi:hypothetical protein